jgi:hypothetical protein
MRLVEKKTTPQKLPVPRVLVLGPEMGPGGGVRPDPRPRVCWSCSVRARRDRRARLFGRFHGVPSRRMLATYLKRTRDFVLLGIHHECDARHADARDGRNERGDALLEAEARCAGRREGKRGESVGERHRVRSVWARFRRRVRLSSARRESDKRKHARADVSGTEKGGAV